MEKNLSAFIVDKPPKRIRAFWGRSPAKHEGE
jgi:hypothetical protein